MLVSIVLRVAERVVTAALHDGGFSPGWAAALAAFDGRQALAVHRWLAILFVLFAGARDAIRAVGPEAARRAFFGR